jgi:hypothetical protein
MLRRIQLMEPEPRGIRTRLAEGAAGLRDGLLRDNKVLPPVLAALALIIFAWLLAGLVIGDPDEEERVARQAAQPSVSQAPDDGSGSSGSPAPGVENRDSESLDVYESKDPFRELFPTAEAGGDTSGDAGSGANGSGSGSDTGGSNGTGTGSDDGSGGAGSDQYGGGGGDSLDQTSPGDSGSDDGSGGNGGGSGGGSGGGDGSGDGSGSGSGQNGDGDGNGALFDSGGGRSR